MSLLAVIERHRGGAFRAVLWSGRLPVAATSTDAPWNIQLAQLREAGLACAPETAVRVLWLDRSELWQLPLAFQDVANGNAELAGDSEDVTQVWKTVPGLETGDHGRVGTDTPRQRGL